MTAQELVKSVMEDGTMNALEGYVELKRLEAQVEVALGQLKDGAIEQARTYGKGEHDAYGAVIQTKSGAGRWDFKHLPWYTNLDMMLKTKQEQAKAAYNAQQKMQPLPVDIETGEEVQPATYTPGAETVSISLRKK
jgi:hypothetical protein